MENAKLNPKALAFAGAVLWGGGVLFVALVNLAHPSYGTAFLKMAASIYPGYHGTASLSQALLGAAFAAIDGGVGGFCLAWLYNGCGSCCGKK